MERNVKVGEFYCHFKNKMYQIKDIAIHSENREKMVIYQALYGDYLVYARPYDMFVSEVDHVKYPEVKQKYRFTKVELDHDGNRTFPEEEAGYQGPDAKAAVANSAGAGEIKSSEESISGATAQAKKPSWMMEEVVEGQVHPGLMAFLDTDDYEEKYNILVALRNVITDELIDAMSVSVDAIIPEGPVTKRYDELKSIVRTRQKYEFTNRLR